MPYAPCSVRLTITSESIASSAGYNQFSLHSLVQKKYIPSSLRWTVTGSSLVKVFLHATQVSIILGNSLCDLPPTIYPLRLYQTAKTSHQWQLTLAVLCVAVSTTHWRSRYGMLLHPRTGKTRSGHDTGGIVLHRNQDDEIHLYRLGTPGNCGARDWAVFRLRREFALLFFSYMNMLFLCPAHKDHRISP